MSHILVVDDDADIRELVALTLRLDGHEVALASDGDGALQAAAAERPDLIVLDVMMPGRDGFSVLEALKADPGSLSDVPVVVLTARTDRMDRIRGGIEGAVAYLTKPFSVVSLRRTVTEVLRAGPEPRLRLHVQREALADLARVEAGALRPGDAARARVTRLEPLGRRPQRPARSDGPPPPPAPPAAGPLPSLVTELLGRCRWPPGGVAMAAVSGGADSLALLVLAAAAGLSVTAVHVDHGLRDGGDAEAEVVAKAAARFGAAFEARRAVVAPGPDLEARARRARYGVLPAGVMTGHTADDLAETVLLNVCWGAGLDGLAPMRAGAGRPAPAVHRPLLGLRRAETRRLCAALHLEPVEDPSNDDLRFRRNQIRHRLLPLLDEIAARDVVPVLARQADLLGDDAALLDHLAAGIDPSDAAALNDAPLPLARRAVRAWLRSGADVESHPPAAAEVARVLDVAAGRVVACEIAGGRRVARSAGRLRISGPDR